MVKRFSIIVRVPVERNSKTQLGFVRLFYTAFVSHRIWAISVCLYYKRSEMTRRVDWNVASVSGLSPDSRLADRPDPDRIALVLTAGVLVQSVSTKFTCGYGVRGVWLFHVLGARPLTTSNAMSSCRSFPLLADYTCPSSYPYRLLASP